MIIPTKPMLKNKKRNISAQFNPMSTSARSTITLRVVIITPDTTLMRPTPLIPLAIERHPRNNAPNMAMYNPGPSK